MNAKREALDIVIAELERSLVVMEANYQKAVSNLHSLRECVDKDDLTRLLRRGAFLKKLLCLLDSSQAENVEVHVMMIDVDHFKRVNDGFGHQTGDVVLERISELVRKYIRSSDLAGRYGGEEIIVAVQATEKEALEVAERIRASVEKSRMLSQSRSEAQAEFNVTLSVGIASTHEFGFEADILIGQADHALYRAKGSGRNQVIQARKPGPTNPPEAAKKRSAA